jgi:D-alanine-D-alanine ligase
MRIGLTYTLRNTHPTTDRPSLLPDDAEEEFDSPETVSALAAAIESLGHEVELLGDGPALLRRLLDGPWPQLVFNIAEGRGIARSREAWIPAMLEMLGVPYTGSDPLTLAATLDKDCAKRLVRDAGLATPRWVTIGTPTAGGDPVEAIDDRTAAQLAALPLPVIVKPACEGSSKGVFAANLIDHPATLLDAVAALRRRYCQPILVEEFIEGDELTVGVVGNLPPQVLSVTRVVPLRRSERFIYSLEVKRDWQRQVDYETPAALSPDDQRAVEHAALGAWQALGCRDVARIDFRLRQGVPYFLEANPLPGLSPTAGDLVILAAGVGIEYRELLRRILAAAMQRLAAVDHERLSALQPAAAAS